MTEHAPLPVPLIVLRVGQVVRKSEQERGWRSVLGILGLCSGLRGFAEFFQERRIDDLAGAIRGIQVERKPYCFNGSKNE